MILWYAAGAVVAVWTVFQSTGLDFRAVALGGLIPLVDVVAGEQWIAHSLLAPTVCLAVVMGATAGSDRRRLRQRIIGIPIGWLFGIALSGAFAHREVFWWPAFGTERAGVALWPPAPWPLVLEVFGALAAWRVWVRGGLADPRRRRSFLTSGRLDLP